MRDRLFVLCVCWFVAWVLGVNLGKNNRATIFFFHEYSSIGHAFSKNKVLNVYIVILCHVCLRITSITLIGVELWWERILPSTWNNIKKVGRMFLWCHLQVKVTTPNLVILLETKERTHQTMQSNERSKVCERRRKLAFQARLLGTLPHSLGTYVYSRVFTTA